MVYFDRNKVLYSANMGAVDRDVFLQSLKCVRSLSQQLCTFVRNYPINYACYQDQDKRIRIWIPREHEKCKAMSIRI